jgi:hypothetical protein
LTRSAAGKEANDVRKGCLSSSRTYQQSPATIGGVQVRITDGGVRSAKARNRNTSKLFDVAFTALQNKAIFK